jgi:NAD(P)-dependent dehydrogenase (short-subunit alcohol dehydrogenase family)
VALYLSERRDAEVTQRAVELEGRQCLLMAGDVRKREFCRKAMSRTVEHFGKLGILVNNAVFQVRRIA